MLESIIGSAGSAISSLLRAQSTGTSAGIAALKTNQQATQAIIDQLQKDLDHGKRQIVPNLAQAPNSSLPRGSLVNILV